MKIIAIDPGSTESAWMIYEDGQILAFGKDSNEDVLSRMRQLEWDAVQHLAIEMIASYGMAVGQEVFETCLWIGRFIEAGDLPYTKVYRKDVKMHLCGVTKAKDSNIRQALLDRFGPPGTKKEPGVTYGISKDVWSALAVAVTFFDNIAPKAALAYQ